VALDWFAELLVLVVLGGAVVDVAEVVPAFVLVAPPTVTDPVGVKLFVVAGTPVA
jgi:hypothetical protein